MSVIIQKVQIKIKISYHLKLVRMSVTKMSRDNKCWQGCGKNRIRVHFWYACKLVQPVWQTVWKFLKIGLPFDLAVSLPGKENGISKRYLCSHVYCSIIPNSQEMEIT